MSLLLAELEANPYEPHLDPAGPMLKYLSCMSEHSADMPKSLRSSIKNPEKWPALAKEMARSSRKLNGMLATTQAIDLIKGGVKVNALPEVVEGMSLVSQCRMIDNRTQQPSITGSTCKYRHKKFVYFISLINIHIRSTSSIKATISHIESIISPLAESLNFTLSAFDESPRASNSHITLSTSAAHRGLEPAPITSGHTKSFELMAGTCKHVFGKDTIVTPTGMYGKAKARANV